MVNEDGKWLKADGTLSDTQVELTLSVFDHEEGSDTYTLIFKNLPVGEETITETTKDMEGAWRSAIA